MSEKIEQVAIALWRDRYPERDWDDSEKRDYMGHARAAIEAMREPTGDMMVAAEDVVPCLSSFADKEKSPSYMAYQAMIDRALT